MEIVKGMKLFFLTIFYVVNFSKIITRFLTLDEKYVTELPNIVELVIFLHIVTSHSVYQNNFRFTIV